MFLFTIKFYQKYILKNIVYLYRRLITTHGFKHSLWESWNIPCSDKGDHDISTCLMKITRADTHEVFKTVPDIE